MVLEMGGDDEDYLCDDGDGDGDIYTPEKSPGFLNMIECHDCVAQCGDRGRPMVEPPVGISGAWENECISQLHRRRKRLHVKDI